MKQKYKIKIDNYLQFCDAKQWFKARGYDVCSTYYAPLTGLASCNENDFVGYTTGGDDMSKFSGHIELYFDSNMDIEIRTPTVSEYSDIPPVGLRPRKLAEEERLKEILAAMERYVEANKIIPYNPIEDFDEINNTSGV